MTGNKPGARVVLKRDGKILLVKRSLKSSHEPGKWEIPGGVVEFLEEILPALKREVREETGIVIYPSHTSSLTVVRDPKQGYIDHVFLCTRFRRISGSAKEVDLSKEHRLYRWATVEEALDMKLTAITQAVMEFLLE
jgi:ADP-ribose pyrophosphatase YjhB (NUDIX family)